MSEDSASSGAKRPDGGAPERRAPPFVVAARFVLLVAAAAALVFGMVRARSHDRASAGSLERYSCPMHPEVVSQGPGDCPICNMALVAVSAMEQASEFTGKADDQQIVATVEERLVSRPIRAAATLGPDGEGTAVLYKDDLVSLANEEPALFFGGSSPNVGADVRVLPDSERPTSPSTVVVRFHRSDAARRAGADAGALEVGSLQIAPRARKLLVVPTSAVLYSAAGPYVLAASPSGDSFAKRLVQIGRILDSGYLGAAAGNGQGAIVVLAGLHEGDRVIAGYTFFVDAERRLREARGAGEDRIR